MGKTPVSPTVQKEGLYEDAISPELQQENKLSSTQGKEAPLRHLLSYPCPDAPS